MKRKLKNHGKVCTISGNMFDANTNNFYHNSSSNDGLHPYHKFYDNMRRTHGISVDRLRQIINFKGN